MHFCEEKDIVYWQISCVLHGHGHHHHIVFWDISSIKPIHASGLNFWLHFCCIRISIRRSNHILLQLHHHHRNQHDQIILTMQVTSILGNTLVLWTVLFHRRMWSLTNYFLVSFDNMDENISSNDVVETTIDDNWQLNDLSGEFGHRRPGHGHSKLHPQVLIKISNIKIFKYQNIKM